jgi:hypothetical protein
MMRLTNSILHAYCIHLAAKDEFQYTFVVTVIQDYNVAGDVQRVQCCVMN